MVLSSPAPPSSAGGSSLALSQSGSSPRHTSDVGHTPAGTGGGTGTMASSPMTPACGGLGTTSAASGSPLSLLGSTPGSRRSRRTPSVNSLGRDDPPSSIGRSVYGEDTSGSADGGPRSRIWGTTVDARQFQRAARKFLNEFRDESQDLDQPPYYVQLLEQALVTRRAVATRRGARGRSARARAEAPSTEPRGRSPQL